MSPPPRVNPFEAPQTLNDALHAPTARRNALVSQIALVIAAGCAAVTWISVMIGVQVGLFGRMPFAYRVVAIVGWAATALSVPAIVVSAAAGGLTARLAAVFIALLELPFYLIIVEACVSALINVVVRAGG